MTTFLSDTLDKIKEENEEIRHPLNDMDALITELNNMPFSTTTYETQKQGLDFMLDRTLPGLQNMLTTSLEIEEQFHIYNKNIKETIKKSEEAIRLFNNNLLKFGLQGKLKNDVKNQHPGIFNPNEESLSDYERSVKDIANLPNEETQMTNIGGKKRTRKIRRIKTKNPKKHK